MSKFMTRKGVAATFVIGLLSVQSLLLTARLDQTKLNYWGRPTVGQVSTIPGWTLEATTLFQVTYVGRDGQPATRTTTMDPEFGNQTTTRVWQSRSGEVFIDTTGGSHPYRQLLFAVKILVTILLIVGALVWWCYRVGFVPYQESVGPSGFVSPHGITYIWAGL